MKKRVIRASVTVTGPPASICRTKVGMTLPAAAEHVAEAHRASSRRTRAAGCER